MGGLMKMGGGMKIRHKSSMKIFGMSHKSGGGKKKKVEAPKGLQMAAPPQMPSASAPAYRSLGAIAAVATEVKQHEEDEQWDAAREMMALFAAQRQMQ